MKNLWENHKKIIIGTISIIALIIIIIILASNSTTTTVNSNVEKKEYTIISHSIQGNEKNISRIR